MLSKLCLAHSIQCMQKHVIAIKTINSVELRASIMAASVHANATYKLLLVSLKSCIFVAANVALECCANKGVNRSALCNLSPVCETHLE